MATPAAVLSIMVKAQGAQAVAGEIRNVDAAGRKAGSSLKTMEGHSKRAAKSFSVLGAAAKTTGALVGGVGLVKALQTMNSEYREAQKVSAQTTAVLKSTGSAAGVTKKHIQDLANAISKKAGIDDEAIQSGENLILTFTKIRNEAGKGNKIFDRTTQVVTDMSVALGQSFKSSAIQVGKALQDPIKGITALRRVGVNFNKQQSDQIAKMVASGHQLEAQRTILKELTKEFGGSAAAQATAGDKLKVAMNNLAEAAGGVLIPQLDKLAVFMTKVVNQFVAGEGIAKFVIPVFLQIKQSVLDLTAVLGPLLAYIGPRLAAAFSALPAPIRAVTIALTGLAAVAIIGSPLMAGLAALAAAAILIHRNWSTVGPIVQHVRDVVTQWVAKNQADIAIVLKAFNDVANVARAVFQVAFPVALATAQRALAGARTAISGMLQSIRGVINVFLGLLHGDWGRVWGGLKDTVAGGLRTALGAAKVMTAPFREIGSRIVNGVIDGLSLLGHTILNKFKDAANFVISNVAGLFKGVGKAIAGGVGKINPFGDGIGIPKSAGKGSAALMGASQSLGPFAAAGARFGLHVSSGLRRGAITSSGNQSYHSSGEAIDEAGSPAGMMGFFKFMKATYGSSLAELIYGPGRIGIKNGQPFNFGSALNAQHMDHVHVAFDTGKPGVGDGFGRARAALTGDGPGKLSGQQLANLWVRAGGDPKVAGLMARIAMAESGGNPAAHNKSGATGLWQILGAMTKGNLTNPLTNARNAVAKYKSQGLGAWAASRGSWGKYVGHPGIKAGKSASKGAAGVAKVNPYDQKIASADVAVADAGHAIGKFSAGLRTAAALRVKQQIVGSRIRAVRAALKGKLTPATRLRLTQELGQLIPEHKQLGLDRQTALAGPATTGGGAGSTDVGGDFGGGADTVDNTDAITALNDTITALNAKLDLQAQQHTDLQRNLSTSQSQYGVLAKAIADVASGQIGGKAGLGFMTPSFAGGMSRY